MPRRIGPLCRIRGAITYLMKRKFGAISSPGSHKPYKRLAMVVPLQLNNKETKLKNLLVDVAGRISATKPNDEPLILRWAGGWVRDKLLGLESHDIDTAINCMTGEAFVNLMAGVLKDPKVRKAHAMSPDDVGALYTVAKNPEKSKHLETASIKIFGLDLDFVNLRKETYTADSRNPKVEFGTAEEDALRRDATVNALFYNLMTDQVEDFTGGVPDLEAKLIRTPMEPLVTFMDDPLRVLRLVRFASRLGFSIKSDVETKMSDPRVLDALKLKISRERVGIEVEKMLQDKHPCEALRLIDNLGLFHAVFTDPTRSDFPNPDISNWKAAYESLDILASRRTPGSIYDVLVRSEEAIYLSWHLAAVAPYEPLPDPAPEKAGKPPPSLAMLASREGLRSPNKLTSLITGAHRHRLSILELKNAVRDKAPYMNERDLFGIAIRDWHAQGNHWRLQVLYALLVEVMEKTGAVPSVNDSTKKETGEDKTGKVSREQIFSEWQGFLDHLEDLQITDAPHVKCLVNGTQLAQSLGVKPGKWTASALDVVMRWQLRNRGVTDPAGAIEEVRSRKEEIGIP